MNALLQRVQREGHPIRGQGDDMLFLWEGDAPPLLHGDFNDWGRLRSPAVARLQSGLWAWEVPIPEGAYVEYNFVDEANHPLPDPLNPGRTVPSGLGHDNHFFFTEGWHVERITLPRPDAGLRGTLTTHQLTVQSFARQVTLYTPPGEGPFDLLVCYDGNDFADRGRLPTTVDNLIAAGRIRPTVLALPDNNPGKRFAEYGANAMMAHITAAHIVPLAAEHTPLRPGPYAIMGASMGGLQALYTALKHPQQFNRVLSLSGAFSLRGHRFPVFQMARQPAESPLQVRLTVGAFDFVDIMNAHPLMLNALAQGGHQTAGRQYAAGHNYTAWAAEAFRDLEPLLEAT